MGSLCNSLKRCGVCKKLVREGQVILKDIVFDVGGAIDNVFCGVSEGDNNNHVYPKDNRIRSDENICGLEKKLSKTPTVRTNNSQRTIRISMCRDCSSPNCK